MTTCASSIACSVLATLARSTTSSTLARRRTPAVSMSTKARPSRSNGTRMLSRVVPGCSLAMTRSSPSSRLTSVDLPTLGRPMMAMRMAPSSGSLGRLRGEPGEHVLHELLAPLPVARGDHQRLAESQGVEVRGHDVRIEALALVEHERHRLAGAAQLTGDEMVLRW